MRRPDAAVLEMNPGPEETVALMVGRRRCAGFVELWARIQEADHQPCRLDLRDLLASAYMQGVRDAAEAIERNGWKPAEGTTQANTKEGE